MLHTSFYSSLFTFLLFGCADSTGTKSAPPPPGFDPIADKAAAQQLIQDIFDNVWSGTDTSNVRRYQTDDFVILEHGEVWTNDTIRNWQLDQAANKRPGATTRLNSFDFFRTEQNDDEIWMAYHNTAHWVNAELDTVGTMGWLESGVAVRTDDGWKLQMMHSTRMPR